MVSFALCWHATGVCAAEIRAQVDRTSPRVAESFWLTLVVRVPDQANVVFPRVPETMEPFHVLSHRDWFDVPVGTQREYTRHFQLESLQGGDFQIPPMSVSVNGETLSSQPIAVSVASDVEAESDPLTFRDIKPPIEIPPPQPQETNWIPWGIAGAAVLFVAVAAVIVMRRRRPLAAGPWALQELERLGHSESAGPSWAAERLPEIAGVLREYIERQFDIRATRQTTEEFLATARRDPRLTEQQSRLLRKFLQHVDEVKFAHRQPEQGRLDDSYRLVQDFVRTTSGDVT
jgi:hypothetical protein